MVADKSATEDKYHCTNTVLTVLDAFLAKLNINLMHSISSLCLDTFTLASGALCIYFS